MKQVSYLFPIANELVDRYRELVNELHTVQGNRSVNYSFLEFIDDFETIEGKLDEIEAKLFDLGFWIDKHHILHIIENDFEAIPK